MTIHRALSSALFLSAALLLVACGDDSGADSAPKPLTLELDSSTVRVRRGDTATLRVTIRPSSNVDELTIVRATQLPPGVTAGDVVLQEGARAEAELTFAASAAAIPGGDHAIHIEATVGEEVLTAAAELTIAGLPGEPDAAFGVGGITTIEDEEFKHLWVDQFAVNESGIYGLLERQDGLPDCIIKVGPDGSLDRAFGTEGSVHIRVPDIEHVDYSLAASPVDDRIVVSSIGQIPETDASKVTVRCLDSTGRPVASCGQDGSTAVPTDWTEGYIGSYYRLKTAIDDKGRLGIALMAPATGGAEAIIHLRRYLPDGTPDPAFGDGGSVSTNVDAFRLRSLVPLGDGGYLLIGDRSSIDEPYGGFATRFTETGAVDVGFGTGGYVALGANPYGAAQAPNGSIYIAGFTRPAQDGRIWGINDRGEPLAGFGDAGVIEVPNKRFYSIATGPDGSIYVPAIDQIQGRFSSSIMRITADGTLDAGFADRTFQVGLHAHMVHLGPDGNLWVGYRVPFDVRIGGVAVGRYWL